LRFMKLIHRLRPQRIACEFAFALRH
jgi:hypothetical protein